MQMGNVGMIETGEHANLAVETRREIGFRSEVRQKHLHGLSAVRNYVTDAIDLPHAPRPKHADNLVIAYPLTYFKWHRVTSGLPASNYCWGGSLRSIHPCMGAAKPQVL